MCGRPWRRSPLKCNRSRFSSEKRDQEINVSEVVKLRGTIARLAREKERWSLNVGSSEERHDPSLRWRPQSRPREPIHAVAEDATPVTMTTRARSTRLLLTCVFVALACATRFPRARAAEVSERERGGAEVSTRASDRFGRLRRFFGGKDLPLSAAAVAAEVDDAPKHHPAAAKELGISVSEFAARGLEPELPPHNVTHERRERRQLGELEGWIDARATWYGGPNGAGPDGMSIYTGSCGYGKALGNHFISAWYVPDPGERRLRAQLCAEPTRTTRSAHPTLSSLLRIRIAGTPPAATTGVSRISVVSALR